MNKTKMNLLIVLNGDSGGGIERFVYNLLRYFSQKEDVNCSLQLLRTAGDVYYDAYLKYANNLYLPVINESDGFIGRVKKYIRIFTQTKPDCVLSFSYWEAAEQCIAAKFSGVPVVIGYRNTIPTRKLTSFFRSIPVNMFAYACVANSSAVASYMANNLFVNKNKVHNYYNGIDLSKYPLKKQCVKKGQAEFKILTVARLEAVKNHHIIIDLARKAKAQKLNWRFLWAGKGSLEKFYLNEIKRYGLERYIKLLGFVDTSGGVYLDSDIFLLTSHNEGLSQALLEACASGLPVVVSDVTGMEDVVSDGENGFLVEKSDIKGFFKVLRKLERDSALREKLGRNARKVVERRFSFEVVADKYFKLLQSCQ